jgi:hypothetical protein
MALPRSRGKQCGPKQKRRGQVYGIGKEAHHERPDDLATISHRS